MTWGASYCAYCGEEFIGALYGGKGFFATKGPDGVYHYFCCADCKKDWLSGKSGPLVGEILDEGQALIEADESMDPLGDE